MRLSVRRGRDGQVARERLQLAVRAREVGALHALGELLEREPSLGRVVAEQTDGAVVMSMIYLPY